MDTSFVVVHIPHASTVIPEEYRRSIILGDEALQAEVVRMTDAFCDQLYEGVGVRVQAPVSRYVCDMERFRDDADEPCAAKGQGLMYTHTIYGVPLREYDGALRDRILQEFYDPHHQRLTVAVDAALAKHGKCLVVDGHSFPDDIFGDEYPEGLPDFDIGTDSFHTPPGLRDALCEKLREMGFSYAVNKPYAGTLVPMKHYGKDKRVFSVMIEANRRLYQNSGEMTKNADFQRVKQACHQLVICAAKWCFEEK
ncbi:MAG: N-formylglutamate amidohydrolase [Defluviitaleaceae bacterium]|nr:N-formylglutamate amidohydrolase [Defluviitaleaceae bacterium]